MKSTPKLPASSVMQMPASKSGLSSAKMKIKSGGVSKKIVADAKGKRGMKNKAC